MSWFNWFSRKPAPSQTARSDRGTISETQTGATNDEARLRDERMDRRERLYGVVRTSLTDAGVVTSQFKFKVLALDDHGHQFLVMVDLAPEWGAQPGWRSVLESKIINMAQSQYGLAITSVYWRSSAELSTSVIAPVAQAPTASARPSQPGALSGIPSRFEPIQEDEVAAFQKALEAASRAPSVPGKIH